MSPALSLFTFACVLASFLFLGECGVVKDIDFSDVETAGRVKRQCHYPNCIIEQRRMLGPSFCRYPNCIIGRRGMGRTSMCASEGMRCISHSDCCGLNSACRGGTCFLATIPFK